MNIAVSATISHTVPPEEGIILAPWVLTGQLVDKLVDRGHNVTLYAVKESRTKATLVDGNISMKSFFKDDLRDDLKVAFLDHALISRMYQDSLDGRFDVIHVHHRLTRAIHFARFSKTPTTITLHDPLNAQYLFDHYQNNPQLHLTPISQNQKTAIPDLPFTDVVYNGVNTLKFSFNQNPESFLLTSGRIVPEKGVHNAIKVAKAVGLPLVIAGEVLHDRPHIERYWNEEIKPHIDNKSIIYIGKVSQTDLAKAYQSAAALLFPIEWEEPFGLVMAEAMSCGTPVIAFRRGSVPEIVEDGKTGFIVNTVDQMIQAVGKINLINRADCRQRVEAHFSLDAMVNGYEKVYQQLIDENKKGSK